MLCLLQHLTPFIGSDYTKASRCRHSLKVRRLQARRLGVHDKSTGRCPIVHACVVDEEAHLQRVLVNDPANVCDALQLSVCWERQPVLRAAFQTFGGRPVVMLLRGALQYVTCCCCPVET